MSKVMDTMHEEICTAEATDDMEVSRFLFFLNGIDTEPRQHSTSSASLWTMPAFITPMNQRPDNMVFCDIQGKTKEICNWVLVVVLMNGGDSCFGTLYRTWRLRRHYGCSSQTFWLTLSRAQDRNNVFLVFWNEKKNILTQHITWTKLMTIYSSWGRICVAKCSIFFPQM